MATIGQARVATPKDIKEYEKFKQGILNDVNKTLQRLRKQNTISEEEAASVLRTLNPAFTAKIADKSSLVRLLNMPMSSFPFLTDILVRAKKEVGFKEEVEEKKEPATHHRDDEFLLYLLDEYKKEQEEKEQAKNSPSTIFCMNCGKKLPSTAQFCYSCGTKVALPEGE